MVEAGDKKSQEPPSAEELAQAERYEAMMAAVAKAEDEDYDLEDEEDLNDNEAAMELAKQRKLLAAVAQQARQYQGLDLDEMEDHEEIMRQIYEENLLLKGEQNGTSAHDAEATANHFLKMQAEALAKNGIDPVQALQMLKSQQQMAQQQQAQPQQQHQPMQMINAPSCLVGNLPNNLDIDLNEVMVNGFGQAEGVASSHLNGGASGQVDMAALQGVYSGDQLQPGMVPTQNQLAMQTSGGLVQKQGQKIQQLSWIQWFCSLEGHEFLLPVDRNFLKDAFNLVQLSELKLSKTRLAQCRALMNRSYAPTEEELANEQFFALNQDASDMYGLIHARYIRSPEGLALVYGKYLQGAYGYCPRAFCDKQRVVPNALSDKLRQNRVKVYCTKCEEMYIPQGTNRLDGAYFGSSLAHVFLQTYAKNIVLPPKVYFYEPQLMGFKMAGKRGSKYFQAEKSGITDTKERQKRIESQMDAGQQRSTSNQQGSFQQAQQSATPQQQQPPSQSSKPRNNKSRHRGRKN